MSANPFWDYKEGVFETSFHPYHFRPLVQHKTDISVFTGMLYNVRTEEPAALLKGQTKNNVCKPVLGLQGGRLRAVISPLSFSSACPAQDRHLGFHGHAL